MEAVKMDHSAQRKTRAIVSHGVQSSAIRLALGCVNSSPPARESQDAGFTQPRAHLIAELCTVALTL